jgi:hypothetical protein
VAGLVRASNIICVADSSVPDLPRSAFHMDEAGSMGAKPDYRLRITPAMAARVTPKLWSLTDMVRVIEDWQAVQSAKINGETMVG